MVRRITVGIAALLFVFASAAPVTAAASVTTIQMRERGVAVNVTNIPGFPDFGDVTPGRYWEVTVMSGAGEATGHNYAGDSLDVAYAGYRLWEYDADNGWNILSDWSGYAADGSAGLVMTLNPGGATLNTAIPVGWCREWPSEGQIVPMDSGGDCLDYVVEGMLTVDLTWTPTSRLFSGSSTDSFGSPGESVTTLRYTGQYRDASVAGDLGLPNIGSFAVTSEFGTIYTRAMGSMELWISRG
jgi:hypothetical protein